MLTSRNDWFQGLLLDAFMPDVTVEDDRLRTRGMLPGPAAAPHKKTLTGVDVTNDDKTNVDLFLSHD